MFMFIRGIIMWKEQHAFYLSFEMSSLTLPLVSIHCLLPFPSLRFSFLCGRAISQQEGLQGWKSESIVTTEEMCSFLCLFLFHKKISHQWSDLHQFRVIDTVYQAELSPNPTDLLANFLLTCPKAAETTTSKPCNTGQPWQF